MEFEFAFTQDASKVWWHGEHTKGTCTFRKVFFKEKKFND